MTTKRLTKREARRQAARDRQARRARCTNPAQPYHNAIGANLCRAILRSYAAHRERQGAT